MTPPYSEAPDAKEVKVLVTKILDRIPNRREMLMTGAGVMAKVKSWERRARPLLDAYEKLTGKRFPVERNRPE